MENEVFEKDYKKEHEESADQDAVNVLDQAIAGGFFRKYSDAMDAYPKNINPEQKESYERILALCDDMARRWGGRLRGEVRYSHWDAMIDLYLPFVEFSCPEELADLNEMSAKANSITFCPDGNSGIRVHFTFRYFDDVMTEEEKEGVFLDSLLSDPKLTAGVVQYADRDADIDVEAVMENARAMKQILDVLEQSTGEDRTKILKRILQMFGEDPDGFHENLQKMMDRYVGEKTHE